MISPEELVGEEWSAWYRLSPVERWRESEKLWQVYFHLGGSLDTQPDTQSPFFDPGAPRARSAHGQPACVFYGAAEFSRDTDLAILASSRNLARLKKSLSDLEAEVIAAPPFEAKYLHKGHAVRASQETREQIRFWFLELRTTDLLIELAAKQG